MFFGYIQLIKILYLFNFKQQRNQSALLDFNDFLSL